jgi:hypothetical protein
MASSVSSERAFSSAGITISKCRNRLKPDIIEALQFLKCMYRHELLFREEPSTEHEMAELDNHALVRGGSSDAEGSWDAIFDDLPEDEDIQDEVFVQPVV